MTEPGPVLVGIDGSADAGRALKVAVDLAKATGAGLVVVHALGLLSVIDGEHVPSHEHRDEVGRLLRDEWCAGLDDVGIEHRIELVDGNPTEVLTQLAEAIEPSFIVVGARGIGASPDRELGSTSYHVTRHASGPVVVVPPHHARPDRHPS